jgi:hypothetical protein
MQMQMQWIARSFGCSGSDIILGAISVYKGHVLRRSLIAGKSISSRYCKMACFVQFFFGFGSKTALNRYHMEVLLVFFS